MKLYGIDMELWLAILLIVGIVVVALLLLALIGLVIWGFVGYKRYPPTTEQKKYAFFVPARNEENVIGDLIRSVQAMDYPQDKITIFILANNCAEDDKTAEIARNLGAEVFELKDSNIKNVGGVLERFFEYIKDRYGTYHEFDGYVRLDADNVVAPDFMEKLNAAFVVNPTVITTYRANKNFNDGIRASLTCMMVTQAMMAFRIFSTWGVNPMITGPGVLMSADVVEKMEGWHCKTNSEDMEFSALLCKMKIKSYYCYDAIFYDEQVNKFKYIFRQRLRWTKGTSQVFFKYWGTMVKRIFSKMGLTAFFLVIGLLPMGIISALFTLGCGIGAIVTAVTSGSFTQLIIWASITLGLNLIPGWLVGTLTFIVERKRTKMIPWYKKILYVLFNPLGFIIHNLSDVGRLFTRTTWKPIPHGKNKELK